MSSTNHTSNYNLSQFIGTDKPAWLSDYNGDMGKIDTAIKNASDAASVADGKGATANTNIGTMSSLTTTEKSTLVGAINEVNSTAGTASTNAGTALSTANAAASNANAALTGLQKFNLTSFNTLTPSSTHGTLTSNMYFATDSTSSVFKLYGNLTITLPTNASGSMTITLGTTSLRPDTAYTIEGAAIAIRNFRNGETGVYPRSITVGTNGVVTVQAFQANGDTCASVQIWLPPCVYFNADFGDVPESE